MTYRDLGRINRILQGFGFNGPDFSRTKFVRPDGTYTTGPVIGKACMYSYARPAENGYPILEFTVDEYFGGNTYTINSRPWKEKYHAYMSSPREFNPGELRALLRKYMKEKDPNRIRKQRKNKTLK